MTATSHAVHEGPQGPTSRGTTTGTPASRRPGVPGRTAPALRVVDRGARVSPVGMRVPGLAGFAGADVFRWGRCVLAVGHGNAFVLVRRRSSLVPGATVRSGTAPAHLFEITDLPRPVCDRLRAAAAAAHHPGTGSGARTLARVAASAGIDLVDGQGGPVLRARGLVAALRDGRPTLHGATLAVREATWPEGPVAPTGVGPELAGLLRRVLDKGRGTGPGQGRGPAVAVFTGTRPVGDGQGPTALAALQARSRTTVHVGRPSALGRRFTRVLGEQPVHTIDLTTQVDLPALAAPLQAYPGRTTFTTFVKRYAIFNRPTVAVLRGLLNGSVEKHRGIRIGDCLDLLTPGATSREEAHVYNFVLTGTQLHLKPLAVEGATTGRIAQWLLAKHVLLSGYSPDVRLAGEMWVSHDELGTTLVLNGSSGTYRPGPERVEAAARLVERLFAVPVEIDVRSGH